eukprot:s3086_g6.t1
MCAKYGMQPAARRMLGYHSSGKDKSMLTYSRDSMAWPIRLLEKMIDDIVGDVFQPDASRSGYFPQSSDLPENSKDQDSTSSSADSMDEEDADRTDEEAAIDKFAGRFGPEGPEESVVYFRHCTSRCLHVTADETGQLFKCGRLVTGQYTKCLSPPQFRHPSCATCFKKA